MKLNFFRFYHEKFQNPDTRMITIICTILYIFSPIDLIPIFVPIFGVVDDSILLIMFAVEMTIWYKNKLKKPKQAKTEVIDVEIKS